MGGWGGRMKIVMDFYVKWVLNIIKAWGIILL